MIRKGISSGVAPDVRAYVCHAANSLCAIALYRPSATLGRRMYNMDYTHTTGPIRLAISGHIGSKAGKPSMPSAYVSVLSA